MAALLGLNWGLQAAAQFPPIPDIPDIPQEIPAEALGLDELLQKEPALTTSLEDAQQEIPFLDDYTPPHSKALRLLPRTETNGFQAQPGDYTFHSQSYCLRAGTHVPGRGDGYLYAPLKGEAADVIQNVLQRSVDHPEIRQEQVQMLLWAIIAQTDLTALPGVRGQVAQTLLTDGEREQLSGRALGPIPNELLQQALQALPPIAQQVFEANAEIRDTITEANSTFEDLEEIAVLLGEPTASDDGRQVPVQRWSYHPEGYFVRYFPAGYAQTRMQVSVPPPIDLTRDDQGRITALTDSLGNRIEVEYDDRVAPLTVSGDEAVSGYAFRTIHMTRRERLVPDDGLSFDETWQGQGWTLVGTPAGNGQVSGAERYTGASSRYQQAVAYQQQQANAFNQVDIASNGAALQDLADVYHLKQAIDAVITPPANTWKADQLALLTQAWQYQLCRHGGACSPIADQSRESLMASANNIYLAQANQTTPGGTAVDPSDGAAVPGNTGKQRLGKSSRPVPEDEIPPEEDPECEQLREELEGLKQVQATFEDKRIKQLARRNDLNTGDEYYDLVKEVIAQKRSQGDDYTFSPDNQRAAVRAARNTDAATGDTAGEQLPVGGSTDRDTCEITLHPDTKQAFINRGEPGAIYDAIKIHEEVHASTCHRLRDPNGDGAVDNPEGYRDYMRDIDNYSRNEIEAYQATIDRLQRELDEKC